MRLRGWSSEEASVRFVVHPSTIRNWKKSLREKHRSESVVGTPPWNKLHEGVRWLVHEIRQLCPERDFGTRTIASRPRCSVYLQFRDVPRGSHDGEILTSNSYQLATRSMSVETGRPYYLACQPYQPIRLRRTFALPHPYARTLLLPSFGDSWVFSPGLSYAAGGDWDQGVLHVDGILTGAVPASVPRCTCPARTSTACPGEHSWGSSSPTPSA